MNKTLKRTVSLMLALFIAAASFVLMPPASASAASMITYSVSYSGKYVRLTFTPKNSSDTIYYTADGSKPSTDSKVYKKTLASASKVTIRALEYTKSGKLTASIKITIKPRVQDPVFTVSTSGGKKYLAIKTATTGVKLYYTTDGSTPTQKSLLYSGKIAYTPGTTVKVCGFRSDMKASKVVSYYEEPELTQNELLSDVPDEIREIFELVNEERTSRGLPALELDKALLNAADIRASEIAVAYGHNRPDDSNCFTVLDENNIPYRAAAENVAAYQKTAEIVMDRWMASTKGHRDNILNKSYKKIGIGHCVSGGVNYWVQIFTD